MVSNFQYKEYFKSHIDRYLKQILIFSSVAHSHFEYNSLWKCVINERKNKPHSHFVIKNSWIPSPCKKSWIVLVSIRLRLKISIVYVYDSLEGYWILWILARVLANEINHLCVAQEQVVIGEKSARGLVLGTMSARPLPGSLFSTLQFFTQAKKRLYLSANRYISSDVLVCSITE